MPDRFENYSYLLPLQHGEMEMQVTEMILNGHVPVIEYIQDPTCYDTYWRMWHLAADHELTTTWILSQIEFCARKNPHSYVRVSGYDKTKKMNTSSFIAKIPADS